MILNDEATVARCRGEGKVLEYNSESRVGSDDPVRSAWPRPLDWLVRHRLGEFRDACAAATQPLHGMEPSARSGALECLRAARQFERTMLYPAYRRLQEALTLLLVSWGVSQPNLPDFSGALATSQVIKDRCTDAVRGFEPRCSLQQAARAACVVWTLRHVAWNLLDQVWEGRVDWYPSNPDWEACDDPVPIAECYGDPAPFPAEIWGIARGSEADDECLLLPLGYVLPDFSPASRGPACALLALRGLGKYGDFYVGHLPVLPLLAWASSAGWPNGLWERIDGYAESLALALQENERGFA